VPAVTSPTAIGHPYALRDAYEGCPHPAPTHVVPGCARAIDFVFTSRHLRTDAVYAALPPPDARRPWLWHNVLAYGLPCTLLPSDHLPVGALLACPTVGRQPPAVDEAAGAVEHAAAANGTPAPGSPVAATRLAAPGTPVAAG